MNELLKQHMTSYTITARNNFSDLKIEMEWEVWLYLI